MRVRNVLASALCLGLLNACATDIAPRSFTSVASPNALPPRAGELAVSNLPGWDQEDHVAALAAFARGCVISKDRSARALCVRARSLALVNDTSARVFIESNFRVVKVGDHGLLTAYFAPEYEARAYRVGAFTAPVRKRPADLIVLDLGPFESSLSGQTISGHVVGAQFLPYSDRSIIEQEAAETVSAWMRPEDLFFMQIQGSGVLVLPTGRRLKATFAGSNGKPFVGIASFMRDRGLLPNSDTSGDSIHRWLSDHRGSAADALMRLNPRYVFFDLSPDDDLEPSGAAGVSLIPGRSLAVDPTIHALGGAYWIDATSPTLAGAFPVYRRLAIALDTGGAIKGAVRADLYAGRGPGAGVEAGRVRHLLQLYELVPIP